MNKATIQRLETVNDGFFALNKDLAVTYIDNAAEQLLACKSNEVLGRNLLDSFPQSSGTILEERLAWAIQENCTVSFEACLGTGSPAIVYRFRVYPNDQGISVYFQPIIEDAEQRQTATEEFRQTKELLQQEIIEREQVEKEREKLLSTEHKQRLQAETLAEATLALTSLTSLADVLDEILRQVKRLVPYRTAHIVLLQGENLRIASWQGYRARGSEALISSLVQPLADFPLDREVVRSQQPVVIADTHQEPRWIVQDGTSWIKSHMVIPICLAKQVLGLLRLDAAIPNRFSAEDVATLQPLVNAAAIALENARLYDHALQEIAERARAEEALRDSVKQLKLAYEQANIYAQELNKEVTERKQAEQEIRRQNRELVLLNRIIAASARGLEPEEILDLACRELAIALKVSQATATLLNRDKNIATVVAEYLTEDGPTLRDSMIHIQDDPSLQHLLYTKAPLVVTDIQKDPRLASVNLYRQRGVVSILTLPLIIENEVTGKLSLETIESRLFSTEEINLAWSVAEQVAGVMARSSLAQTRQRLTTAIEQAAESVVVTDTGGAIIYVNPAFERITGCSRAEAIGQNMVNLFKSDQQDDTVYQTMWTTIQQGEVWHGRLINKKKNGSVYTEDATISPVRSDTGAIVNYVAVMRDVTHELQLEEQYRQAQKMEAIGLLAGGIAHDFNNLLTAINGFAEMLVLELSAKDMPTHELAGNILKAGQRAADLVRQLLAFSRKQIIQPQVLDLNKIVSDMGSMLGRLIGSHIEMTMSLAQELWHVKVDPAQLEQVVVNLVVNACDAMPEGGRLIIETANVVLDEAHTADRLGVQPGEYVVLSVSDTGLGMSKEVQSHIFEPFFTTKEKGKGTGLGLSTVFGIVKQNGGHIFVYSEPGQGTTFKIYLSRTDEAIDTRKPRSQRYKQFVNLPQGQETVFLVEDEAAVRDLAARILRRQGYTVVEASNGEEALKLIETYTDEIHILLTDTIMPKLGGEALATQFRTLRPAAKILFTSGYSDKIIVSSDVLGDNIEFIQKPFSAVELANKIRSVLDS